MYTAAPLRSTRFEENVKCFEILETESRKKFFLDVKDIILNKTTLNRPVAVRGPVGSGKSYSLLYVIHRLKQEKHLQNNLFIVYFNDCGCFSGVALLMK